MAPRPAIFARLVRTLLVPGALLSVSLAAPKDESSTGANESDGKVAAVSAAMESAYGKLFEGAKRDAQGRVVLRFSGHDFLFDDGKVKTAEERINAPDMEDMFAQLYPLTNPVGAVEKDSDPGRARVEEFFKLLYGGTEAEVSKNLQVVNFCGTKVRFNSKCGAADALTAVAKDLEALIEKKPALRIFTKDLGGTFQWRVVAGTKRLSNHSFGTAIDLNVKKSDYWQWDPPARMASFSRKSWPTELVEIFERHGFVWGGKWWHYDTMHFEYRPELMAFAKAAIKEEGRPRP